MDDVAAAIADPVRREILTLLRAGPMVANAIVEHFDISRPAISRHLRVLREGGLVHSSADGRQRIYTLDARPLAEIDRWLEPFRGLAAAADDTPVTRWNTHFDALATEVHRTRRHRRDATETSTHTPPASEERTA